jgi:hypothetical protein
MATGSIGRWFPHHRAQGGWQGWAFADERVL